MAEVTVPYAQAMRYTKTYGWQPNLRLYYGSVHWIDGIDEGPDGDAWYRVFDELIGFPYHVRAIHLRPIPFEEWSPITPEAPLEQKRIEVSLSKQVLTAYEDEEVVLQTTISSGIATVSKDPKGLSTQTPTGEFRILSKYPSKHMGNGNLFATPKIMNCQVFSGHVFFTRRVMLSTAHTGMTTSAPMSRGCVNMRIEEAKWLFRWVRPLHEPDRIYTPGFGTSVVITS